MKRQRTSSRKKQQVKVSALIGLMIVLIALAIGRMLPSSSASAADERNDPAAHGATSLAAPEATARPRPRRITVDWPVDAARDPFAWDDRFPVPSRPTAPTEPATINPPKEVTIHLQGIVYGEAPWAIIDGRIARVNDLIGDVRIVRIEKRFIIVERDNTRWQIDL